MTPRTPPTPRGTAYAIAFIALVVIALAFARLHPGGHHG